MGWLFYDAGMTSLPVTKVLNDSVSVHGTTYKIGCVMWIGQDEEEMPSFALVKDICVVEVNLSGIWFVTEVLHTAAFNKHFNVYEVNNTKNLSIIKQQDLPYPLPLHIITITDQEEEKHFVCPKYQIPSI